MIRLDIRKNSLIAGVVRDWNEVPREGKESQTWMCSINEELLVLCPKPASPLCSLGALGEIFQP